MQIDTNNDEEEDKEESEDSDGEREITDSDDEEGNNPFLDQFLQNQHSDASPEARIDTRKPTFKAHRNSIVSLISRKMTKLRRQTSVQRNPDFKENEFISNNDLM